MFKEFRAFISRGNVLDLAVAVIIGAAFGKIVTSLTDDIIMPVIVQEIETDAIGQQVQDGGDTHCCHHGHIQMV